MTIDGEPANELFVNPMFPELELSPFASGAPSSDHASSWDSSGLLQTIEPLNFSPEIYTFPDDISSVLLGNGGVYGNQWNEQNPVKDS